jgi:microcin C transport system substrate-binding protein
MIFPRHVNMTLSRRTFLRIASGLAIAPSVANGDTLMRYTRSDSRQWRHGLSLFGDLRYPPHFPHFDYVNPQAPKGGTVRRGVTGTFDNFNMAVDGVKGVPAAGIDLIYETLLTPSLDEVSSAYGLLAEAVSHPADFSSATYRLCGNAKWHDGAPITPEDVVFSFNAFKKHNPRLSAYYRHVVRAQVTGPREVKFSFDSAGNRELPQIVGQLTVLPKHWWQATDKSGHRRKIGDTTLEAPLGSGPYRVKSFDAGRTIIYQRVDDYWGKDLNVRVGQNNFDELRFDYFRDAAVEFEAFKAGAFDWRTENVARNWTTGYGFQAARQKRVVLEQFPIRNVGIMQAFAFNTRRGKFADARLRRAFNFAFDFESVNRDIFYGQYTRIASYFQGTELACTGVPEGRELEILAPLRGQIPDEVFTTPYWNPVGGGPAADRKNLLGAMTLLEASGFAVRDLKLVDLKTSEQLRVEFLLADPTYERFVLFYQDSLERLGIDVSVRTVDSVQYENRLRDFDFDIIVASWEETLTPGNELRDYWGSRAAATPGSRNLVGIADKAIDLVIERIVYATDRAEQVAATQALDRVLLWHHYVVPQWSFNEVRTARWNRFAKPNVMPTYGMSAFPDIWWWDAQLATTTDRLSDNRY